MDKDLEHWSPTAELLLNSSFSFFHTLYCHNPLFLNKRSTGNFYCSFVSTVDIQIVVFSCSSMFKTFTVATVSSFCYLLF